MPVLLLVVLAVLIVAVVSYNASRATVSKMELINAADGAAYSGALQTARSMNFMAYTSRGMIANTIAAGYLVSYISHLRHLAAGIDELTKPRQLLAKVASFAAGSFKEQVTGIADFKADDTNDDVQDPMLEPLLDPDAPRSDDPAFGPDAAQQDQLQNEANQTQQDNNSVAGNKFQRAGRFGGAVLDKLATTIGYGTIPLTDLLNTAYAGIQLAEYAAISNAVNGTMTQVAAGYGDDILVTDDNTSDIYAWMLPVRPGIDGFGISIPKTFKFNLGKHIGDRAVSTGNPLGGIAGIVSRLALGALGGEGALKRASGVSLSPMHRLINGSITFYDDERFMVWERAWRACFQMVPTPPGLLPLAPIPLNPGADDRLDVYVTPPCTPPFVPPALPGMAQVAIDKTGGSSLIFAREAGSESGREIMRKRGKAPDRPEAWEQPGNPYEDDAPTGRGETRGDGLWGVLPGNPYEDGINAGGSSIGPSPPQSGSIEDQANRPENQARRSGNRTDRRYSDLSDRSPMRQAVKQTQQAVIEQFRNRLYSSGLGQQSGIAGLAKTLAKGAAWGADWQSEDKIEMGAFVWRPKFQALFPFINIPKTLFASKFDLEGNELAWGGATAKEFWPTYQGVPMYMALTELPWTDGLSYGLDAKQNGRSIDVEVRRPVTSSLLDLGFMDAPDDIEFQATARGEVFYYRQPDDDDNYRIEENSERFPHGYFPVPGSVEAPLLSPFAGLAASVLTTSNVEWFNLMTNWYGQKWANTQIAVPIMLDLLKPSLGISKELPNLLTPFWDARLAQL